jgi:hypothetical protein
MKKLLLALLIASPIVAQAEKIGGYFLRSDGAGNALMLTMIPCPIPQWADQKVASEYVGGERARRGCWKQDAGGSKGVTIHYTNNTTERDWLDRFEFSDKVPTL